MNKIYLIITIILSLVIGVTLSGVIGNFTDDMTKEKRVVYDILNNDSTNYNHKWYEDEDRAILFNFEEKEYLLTMDNKINIYNFENDLYIFELSFSVDLGHTEYSETTILLYESSVEGVKMVFTEDFEVYDDSGALSLFKDETIYLVSGTSAQITGTTATLVNMIPLIVVLSIVITGVVVIPKISKQD